MSGKTIVILQSNYIPWKGYFDLIAVADEFLLFDEVQYTKNDWRNRNRIVLNGKLHWLTLPVRTAGAFGAAIDRIEVSKADWAKAHWDTVRQAYREAPYFRAIAPKLEEDYRTAGTLTRLSSINEHFLRSIATQLGLDTTIMPANVVPRTTLDPHRASRGNLQGPGRDRLRLGTRRARVSEHRRFSRRRDRRAFRELRRLSRIRTRSRSVRARREHDRHADAVRPRRTGRHHCAPSNGAPISCRGRHERGFAHEAFSERP